MSDTTAAPPSLVPPILTSLPELASAPQHNEGGLPNAPNTSSDVLEYPQTTRQLIAEVKTYPEDLQALSVDPSLVAYLSGLYQNKSFAGAIPPPTPAVVLPAKGSAILNAITVFAQRVGLAEAWSLIRKLSPSPFSDLNEAFRLFFGSNIAIFPYLASLGGVVGNLVCSLPVAYMLDACIEMQCEAKDVAVNVILKQLVASDRSRFFGTASAAAGSPSLIASRNHQTKSVEQQLRELEDFCARHLSVSSYFRLAEILWTYPVEERTMATDDNKCSGTVELLPVSEKDKPQKITTSSSSNDGGLHIYTELAAASPEHKSRQLPHAASLDQDLDDVRSPSSQAVRGGGSHGAETSAAVRPPPPRVEVRSVIPSLVRWIVAFAQFTSTCCFAILIAANIEALGLSLSVATVLSCAGLLVTLIALTPTTVAVFAMINNIGMLGSSVILVIATLLHQSGGGDDSSVSSPSTDDDAVWLFFRTPTDAFMFFSILLGYTTPALFTVDVETNIARRCAQRVVAKLTGGRDKSLATPGALASPVSTSVVVASSSLDGRGVPSQLSSQLLHRRFHLVTLLSLAMALVVLLGFGEFIFVHFKSRTNAVIALSLRPGFLRTLLLWDLVVSIFACASLNVVGLPNILDDLQLSERLGMARTISKQAERVLLRVAVMSAVLVTLFVIPYFDLVASLAGCLGANAFTLFLPVLFQLQSIRRRAEAGESNDTNDLSVTPRSPSALIHGKKPSVGSSTIGWWDAFCRAPSLRVQFTMVVMITFGSVVLVTGVGSCISQLIARLAAARDLAA